MGTRRARSTEEEKPTPEAKQVAIMMPNSSLLQWLATFKLDGKNSVELRDDAYYNLADGYVCARILNQISPQYFSDKWLEGIKPVAPNGSWRLRVSNLKRILQKIYDYASDLQSPQFRPSAITPDVAVIAQNFDPDQISRLIQLILFCAINSDKKQEYIEKIRDLSIQVKQDIKEAIEELLTKDSDGYNQEINTSQFANDSPEETEDNENRRSSTTSSHSAVMSPSRSSMQRLRKDSSKISAESLFRRGRNISDSSSARDAQICPESVEELRQKLQDALKINDEQSQARHELELKVKELQLANEQLALESDKQTIDGNTHKSPSQKINNSRRSSSLFRKFSDSDTSEKSSPIKGARKDAEDTRDVLLQQNQKLQLEISRLKEDLIKVESEREEHRLNSNLLKEDLEKLTSQHSELRNKAEQAKRLQDELDEHKQATEKITSYENIIENLNKRNNDLKKELKSLTDENIFNVQNIVKLKEEINQLATHISRIEVYKRQLQETQIKLSQETHRADRAELELSRLSESYSTAVKENEKLYQTTNQLMRVSSQASASSKEISFQGLIPSNNENYKRELGPTSSGQAVKGPENETLFEGARDFEQQPSNDILSSMSASVLELKERVARTEYENEVLQSRLNVKRENDLSVLTGLLENATSKCNKLEIENRHLRKKILLLEYRIRDLMNSHNQSSSSMNNQAAVGDSSSDNTLSMMNRIEELQKLLFQKEHELMESEAKYNKNIQKARDVIRTLNINNDH